MRIAGIFNFNLNKYFDLSNIKPAEVKGNDIPKPHQKYCDVYVGGFETYSKKSMKENMENLDKMFRNMKVKNTEWECVTMTRSTGETYQFMYNKSLDLHVTNINIRANIIDIQI